MYLFNHLEKKINHKNEEYDIALNVQNYITSIKLTTIPLNKNESETVFYIHFFVGLFDMKRAKGLNSARNKHVLYNLPKTTRKTVNPLISAIENIEDSYEELSDTDLECQGIGKIIIA